MKPTIGRIVLYNHSGADGLPAVQYPAIVQSVMSDESVRLVVFGPYNIATQEKVIQGDGPGEWNWPPRT